MAIFMAELILSLFAVFGLYEAVRLFVACFFTPIPTGVVLELREPMLPRELEAAVAHARDQRPPRGGPVVALLHGSLAEDEELLSCLTSRGVICYAVEED